ncbi:MAG TPA: phosphohistidine phosphatase SixA [Terriglobales bacterium]|jgi:phosphohistidine phosphatase|nr:phosphohistidine phosphatase SixA [Terriglobales bacterium]
MILYIVRHGIAVDRTDPNSPPEPERPLTARGVKKTRLGALGLAKMGIKPDLFITSPLIRAVQTAEIVAEALGFAPNKIRASDDLKPAANPAEFLKELARLKAKEVMCVGHAPHLDTMISQLAGARGVFTSLKKAGVACFEHGASQGRWELLWLATPKMLRQLAE